MGQPELKRELGTLGHGAQQHQDQRHVIKVVAANDVSRGQDDVQIVAANDVADDQQADKQRQAARRGYDQRHASAIAGIAAMVPVADQQKGDDAGQLPENG